MFEFWKSTLLKNEQATYEYVVKQYLLGKRKIFAPCEISNEGILNVYRAISFDHPELFQLPSSCSVAQQISLLGKQNIYMMKDLYSKSEEEKIKSAIQVLQKNLLDRLEVNNPLGAIKEITKWFVENVYYHIDNEFNQNAASALYFKRAQCSGYSKGFKLLMDSFNIPCIIVEGSMNNSGDISHAWNLVKLENNWYHIDITNIVPYKSAEDSPYYLVSDNAIKKTHTWHTNIPSCPDSFFAPVDEEVFYSTYEVGVHLKRAYLKRETLVRFNAEICDEPSLNQEKVLDFIRKWYSQNANNISFRIQAKNIKFEIEIEYM